MDNRFSMGSSSVRLEWKDYQVRLRRIATSRRRARRMRRYLGVFLLLIGAGFWVVSGSSCMSSVLSRFHTSEKIPKAESSPVPPEMPVKPVRLMDKAEVRGLLGGATTADLSQKRFDISSNGRNYHVTTTLDSSLQNFMMKSLNPATVRYIGIVAMEPSTGKVLAMAGYDRLNPSANPCLNNIYPAASTFKIITASAAVDRCNFYPETTVSFTGGKHTLYKSQLINKTSRYSQKITLMDSFAQSVNPVFAKIGMYNLGGPLLEQYADSFGFNKSIDFEVAIQPSVLSVDNEPFHLAEVSCGYNHVTAITPLHGAMIVSGILNRGAMTEPSIVDHITDDKGDILYRSQSEPLKQVVSPRTSEIIAHMMEATISSGTGRRAFRGYRKDHILSRLEIGGKTGTIDNQTHEQHYDWFIGFAANRSIGKKIVVSVVVVHEKFLGTRSGQYGRMAMKQYFTEYFADRKSHTANKNHG